jgi:hypothetical protein
MRVRHGFNEIDTQRLRRRNMDPPPRVQSIFQNLKKNLTATRGDNPRGKLHLSWHVLSVRYLSPEPCTTYPSHRVPSKSLFFSQKTHISIRRSINEISSNIAPTRETNYSVRVREARCNLDPCNFNTYRSRTYLEDNFQSQIGDGGVRMDARVGFKCSFRYLKLWDRTI